MTMKKFILVLLAFTLCFISACSSTSSRVPPSAQFDSGFDSHSPKMGKADAPIKVYMFSDFACKHCRSGSVKAKQLIMTYPEQVQVIYKHFPNRRSQGSNNAAKAARAAALQNRFWDMHDILFQFARTHSKPELRDIADILALDIPKFIDDFSSENQARLIEKDVSLARSLGVQGTPAFLINGQVIHNVNSAEQLVDIVDRELRMPSGLRIRRGSM